MKDAGQDEPAERDAKEAPERFQDACKEFDLLKEGKCDFRLSWLKPLINECRSAGACRGVLE